MTDAPRILAGHHFRWDLDKTYLKTDFDTFQDLLRTFRQTPEEKQAYPGVSCLLRELMDSASEDEPRYVTFISGSPRQMRRVLTAKLELDGIEPDAFILKPNLSNLLLFRLKALRGQVGYKLDALLRSRRAVPQVPETLFGDDAERDAFIYSLYADLLAGRVGIEYLDQILDAADVLRREARSILEHAEALSGQGDVVDRIFIHLDRRSPPARFGRFGARVVPVYNYFQASLLLFEDDLLSSAALLRVVDAMGEEGYTPTTLANSLQDLMRRGFLRLPLLRQLATLLDGTDEVLRQPASVFGQSFLEAFGGLEQLERPYQPRVVGIDYLALAEETKYKRTRHIFPRLPWLRD